MKNFKRLLSVVLVCMMIVPMILSSFSVSAADGEETTGCEHIYDVWNPVIETIDGATDWFGKVEGICSVCGEAAEDTVEMYDYVEHFTDVQKNHWFMSEVAYCVKQGYVSGMTETTFAPNNNLTRAQFLTLLAAVDGVDLEQYKDKDAGFEDVKTSHWWNAVICWAVENEYTAGISETKFGPNNQITRSQLARFFYVYTEKKGLDVSKQADLTAFTDAGKVQEWAEISVKWAVAEGLISGTTATTLAPNATATRAQAARIIMLYTSIDFGSARGSYENPYLISVGDTRLVVTVPAGSDAYVKADNSNGSILTVGYASGADYMINYLRQTYYGDPEADNGTSFTMVSDVDFFCVTNTGDEAIVLYMALAAGEADDDTTGTMDNPEVISAGVYNPEFSADSQGRFYSFTAPEDGTVEVIMYSESWQYFVNNITAGTYGDTHWSDDEEPIPCEILTVAAGDELQIMVNTYDGTWSAPAGTLSWELTFTADETDEPTEPELGEYDNPYIVNIGDTRVAAYIPAGETVYVKASDSNNSIFTLGYATAGTYEIWYLRQLYTADTESGNNDTSFTMVVDVDTFGITNTGDEAITVYMALEAGAAVDNSGTMDAPEELTFAANMWGGVGANADYTFEAGNQGRYYKVVAPADGQIVFRMMGAIDAEYNNIGWFYNINNNTAYKYGDNHWSDDEIPAYDEAWNVSAGDELVIFVSTYDPANMWANPAGTVSFSLSFNAIGSSDMPCVIEAGVHTPEISEGSWGYYYTFTAPENGTVEVTMNSENWQYVVNNITAGTYCDTHWSDDETPVASETLTVSAGDEILIMVNTYDPANPWTAPAGTLSWELTFIAD